MPDREDWAVVRLVPEEDRKHTEDEFVVFRGDRSTWEAERHASKVILQRYGRAVEWFEVNPWSPACYMVARVISGGQWIPDVHYVKGFDGV